MIIPDMWRADLRRVLASITGRWYSHSYHCSHGLFFPKTVAMRNTEVLRTNADSGDNDTG